jgi:hypothetical protein
MVVGCLWAVMRCGRQDIYGGGGGGGGLGGGKSIRVWILC